MRFPKAPSIGIRLPFVRTPTLPALGRGSMSSLVDVALAAAFRVLALLTLGAVLVFLILAFVPLGPLNLIATSEDSGTSVPVPRAYLLFGVGAFAGYFAGFALILRHLRRIVHSLRIGDPFQPANVSRLKEIGLTLATVTGGAWIGQALVSRLVRGELEPPGLFDLVTPAFSVLVVFVLAEVFREGARLRRESELTI
jgi:hypothetical protein